jgi:hypothetical protein
MDPSPGPRPDEPAETPGDSELELGGLFDRSAFASLFPPPQASARMVDSREPLVLKVSPVAPDLVR